MNRKKIALFLVLCLMIALFGATASMALETTAPSSLTKNSVVNSEIPFEQKEILNLFPGQKVAAITFTSMPDPQQGSMLCGSEELLIMENVSKKEISTLRFVPVMDFVGECEMTIKALDKKNNHIGTATIKLCMMAEENYPPSAKDGEAQTQKNIQITGKLFGADPENDTLTYQIVNAPKKGSIELAETGSDFVYTPKENKTGNDVFTYQVSDQYGNKSEVATMKVRIEKPTSKLTYSDMSDHWAHYPAIKLAEKGILQGTQVGASSYFDPDGEVTRGEFTVMLMQTLKTDLTIPTVSQTVFVDDETIPTWMKGYVAAAVSNQIVSGQGYEEGAVFDAMSPITRAQACVMLNNILNPAETQQTISHFSDVEGIPVWAMEAMTTMSTCGILNGFDDQTVRSEECLTRAQACTLLWEALEYQEEITSASASTFSIFNWFGR